MTSEKSEVQTLKWAQKNVVIQLVQTDMEYLMVSTTAQLNVPWVFTTCLADTCKTTAETT